MNALRKLWLATMVIIPFLASWIWWEGGMWSYGALPTHVFFQVVAGCVLSLILYGLVWLYDRRNWK